MIVGGAIRGGTTPFFLRVRIASYPTIYSETVRGNWNGSALANLGDEIITATWNQHGAVRDRASYTAKRVQRVSHTVYSDPT